MQAPLWLGRFKPISFCILGTHPLPQAQMAKPTQSRREKSNPGELLVVMATRVAAGSEGGVGRGAVLTV